MPIDLNDWRQVSIDAPFRDGRAARKGVVQGSVGLLQRYRVRYTSWWKFLQGINWSSYQDNQHCVFRTLEAGVSIYYLDNYGREMTIEGGTK